MSETKEVWKPVHVDFYSDMYEVSSHGRVRSLDHMAFNGQAHFLKAGRVLKGFVSASGYRYVDLSRDAQKQRFAVHFLVATAFLGPCPEAYGREKGCWEIDHLDGDRLNNHKNNLEWVSQRENLRRCSSNWEAFRGSNNHQSNLDEATVREIRNRYEKGETQQALADDFQISRSNVGMIVRRVTWQHVD